jgi:hypothetical protein
VDRPQNKHLRPWKKGQSGNPKGVPKRSLTTLLREAGEKNEIFGEPMPPGMTVAEAFASALWGHAIKGNPTMAGHILDRLEGKVSQPSTVVAFDASKMTDDEILARIASLAGGVASAEDCPPA